MRPGSGRPGYSPADDALRGVARPVRLIMVHLVADLPTARSDTHDGPVVYPDAR